MGERYMTASEMAAEMERISTMSLDQWCRENPEPMKALGWLPEGLQEEILGLYDKGGIPESIQFSLLWFSRLVSGDATMLQGALSAYIPYFKAEVAKHRPLPEINA